MAKIVITNPDDLYTVQGDLVTENYQLGLIGWKNPNDLIKYDESFMKIDTKLKGIENDKYDKTGGLIEGIVTIKSYGGMLVLSPKITDGAAFLEIKDDDGRKGFIGKGSFGRNNISVSNSMTNKELTLHEDGKVYYNNHEIITDGISYPTLSTTEKTLFGAINELNDEKFDKTGGTITGDVFVENAHTTTIRMSEKVGGNQGSFYINKADYSLVNKTGGNRLSLFHDGTTQLLASNLETDAKEVVTAINEVKESIDKNKETTNSNLDKKYDKTGGTITGVEEIITLDTSRLRANYIGFRNNGVRKGAVGKATAREDAIVLKNDVTNKELKLHEDGKVYYDNGEIWHNGNSPILKSQNGYTKLPNGLIMQWGYIESLRNNPSGVVNLPISFTDTNFSFLASPAANGRTLDSVGEFEFDKRTISKVYVKAIKNSAFLQEGSFKWIAIGY